MKKASSLNNNCNKSSYSSYGRAQQQVRRALKNRKLELRQYFCKSCGSYHLTSIVGDYNKHVLSFQKKVA